METLIRFDRNSARLQWVAEKSTTDVNRSIKTSDLEARHGDATRRLVPTLEVLAANGLRSGIATIHASNAHPPPILPWLLSNGTGFETTELQYIHYFMTQFPNDRWDARLWHPIATYLVMRSADEP